MLGLTAYTIYLGNVTRELQEMSAMETVSWAPLKQSSHVHVLMVSKLTIKSNLCS